MKNKNVFLFLFSFVLFSSYFLYSQTITITNPTEDSKWRGTQTITWEVNNKSDQFRGITPSGSAGYYKIFYAPEGTEIPGFEEEPSSPWEQISEFFQDDGKEASTYNLA